MGTAKSRAALPQPVDRLALGSSGLEVSPICIGIVSDPNTICEAYDAGINFFFLAADMHWPLYESTRRGLARLFARDGVSRSDVVVAAATYVAQPEFLSMPFMEVVACVPGLDRIDVLISGGTYMSDFLRRTHTLREHRDDGLVGARGIGASFHDRACVRLAGDAQYLDLSLVRYNARHTGAITDVFPYVPTGRRQLLFNFKSAHGFVKHSRLREIGVSDDYFMPSVPDHYRFVLTRPELDGMLCSPQTPSELRGLLEALLEGPLTPEDERHLVGLSLLDEKHS